MSKQFKAGDTVLVINCENESFNQVFTVIGKRDHSYSNKPLIAAHPLGDESTEVLFHAWELQFRLTGRPYDLGRYCDHTVCCLAPR